MNLLDSINTVIPLSSELDVVIRVGNTRVTLETVVHEFKNGSTAEEIVYQYPVLDLSDVYAVISFYLKNQTAVESYLLSSKVAAERIQTSVQQHFPAMNLRQRLLANGSLNKQTTPDFFAQKAIAEAGAIWDEKGYSDDTMTEWLNIHERKKGEI